MIVFTNGCFDLLHAGHVSLLRFCRELARDDGRLIVALNSDESTARLKPGRPICGLEARAASIAMLRIADEILVFDSDEPTSLIRQLRPDVLVKGDEYRGRRVPGEEYVGRVEFAPMVMGVSTTRILQELAGA